MKRDKSDISAASLFVTAADRLRNEFEEIINPHSGDKGTEVEEKFRRFLNERIPKRFQAGQGLIVDHDGGISRQQDVIIYDSLVSLVYRASEHKLILPIDNVPAIIEIKSRLDGPEIADAYEKIASCKALKKQASTPLDRSATGTDVKAVGTLGIIFAYSSTLKIQTVAEKARQLNQECDSGLWPDAIVLLDRGIITYDIKTPSGQRRALHKRPDEPGAIPLHLPFYVEMAVREDKTYVLNRFFSLLLEQLADFPYRRSSPPPGVLIDGAPLGSYTCCIYQFNSEQKLIPAEHRDGLASPDEFLIASSEQGHLGELSFEQRNDGGVVKWRGNLPDGLMSNLLGRLQGTSAIPLHEFYDGWYTNVMAVTAEQFRQWPDRLKDMIQGITWKLATRLENKQGDVYTSRLFFSLRGFANGALDHRQHELAEIIQIHSRIMAALIKLSGLLSVPFRLQDLIPDFEIDNPLSQFDTNTPGAVLGDIVRALAGAYKALGLDMKGAWFGKTEASDALLHPDFCEYLENVRAVWLDNALSSVGLESAEDLSVDLGTVPNAAKQHFDDAAALIENSLIYLLDQQLPLPWALTEIFASDRRFKTSPRFQVADSARRKWKPKYKRATFEEL